ncbi:hypothetical protein NP493_267g03061 [Ridgeia piscesae]|uniref:Transmembrane protein 180 n=1 Tax=Ridgeia piscesae TaxID=27915 RepID=A0AAD9NXP2_RIDPI|nr:hypothetical protein NP493_267g03061 [Ridgeia piscesae]
MKLHAPSVAFASTSLGYQLMHAVFNFFYVTVYMERFHVSHEWFQVSQVIFMVWNAINDPLFAYVQDNYRFSIVKSRRHSILYGAPLFALSFLVVWFPWGDYSNGGWLVGVQLTVSLCFYDSLFTFVLLAHCALFTELSTAHEDRVRLVRYSRIASVIGYTSVYFTNVVSDNMTQFPAFLGACVVIALLSVCFMAYTGLNSSTHYDKARSRVDPNDSVVANVPDSSFWQQTAAILRQRNFVTFVLMNFCQTYHSTFLANFTRVICEELIPADFLTSQARSIFYGTLTMAPAIVVILGSPVLNAFGYFRIIRLSFLVNICTGVSLLCLGRQPWVVMVFFFVESITTYGAYALFNLCLSDVIDEDRKSSSRTHPRSSMIFGTNALITKPAVSLAPMIAVAFLSRFGYQDAEHRNKTTFTPDHDLADAMFYLAAITPIVVGIVQLFVWGKYNIRDSHITIEKYVDGCDT